MLSLSLAIILSLFIHFYLKVTLYRTFLIFMMGFGVSMLLNIHFKPENVKLDVKSLDSRYFTVVNTFPLISYIGKDGETPTYYNIKDYNDKAYVTFSYIMRNGEPTKVRMPFRMIKFRNDDRNEVDLLFYGRRRWGNIMLSIFPYKETAVCYEIHSKVGEIL